MSEEMDRHLEKRVRRMLSLNPQEYLTCILFERRVNPWCQECDEEIEIINTKSIGYDVPSLEYNNSCHVTKDENEGSDPTTGSIRCPCIQ